MAASRSSVRRAPSATSRQLDRATITFPLPVDATLTALEARIGDRGPTGVAKARDAARETYEDAIDEGRSAVLHEEALRGIHASVFSATFRPAPRFRSKPATSKALAFGDATPRLRIPTSVGDIYGTSPLLDSDDLVHGSVVHEAEIEIGGARAVDSR